MTDAGFFRGTSAEQDNRFSDKEKKLMKQMKFGDNVTKKVDMSKIKIDVLRPWISKRIEEMLGMEDDVIEEFVVNQLEADQVRSPDGRRIQINLTGFLNGKNARIFTAELWDMLLSAQEQATGIPVALIESKKEEIKKRNEEHDKEKLNNTLKKTVSRFVDKLKLEGDSNSPKSSSNADHPSSSLSSSIKREKTSPDQNREVDFSKRKDDGGRRQYRSRRTSSPPSPSRRNSRSRSRDRDRDRDFRDRRPRDRRDRDRSRDRDRDRRHRERSRSPAGRIRRSPLLPRAVYNRDRSRSRDRERERERDRPNPVPAGSRRFSDHNDGERAIRNSRDHSRDRLRQRSRSPRDREDRQRSRSPRDREVRQRSRSPRDREERTGTLNGKSVSYSVRAAASPPPRDRERERMSGARERDNLAKRSSVERDVPRRKEKVEEMEQDNSEQSNDSDEPQKKKKDKKNKKEKKKHKKRRKSKKAKKSKNGGGASNSEEEDEVDNDESDRDSGSDRDSEGGHSAYLKGSLYQPTSEDLEKKLRERALESLKKANSSH